MENDVQPKQNHMSKPKNIVLIGLMGSGKTSVGKDLAERLHYRWTDTDAEVEGRVGKRIPDIFQEEGEERFREMESQVLLELLQSSGQVISTGGGIILREENVAAMKKGGLVVYLKVELSELIRRLKDSDRPLIQGDMETRIKEIWKRRQGMYDFAHLHIDTTHRRIPEIVEEILRHLS